MNKRGMELPIRTLVVIIIILIIFAITIFYATGQLGKIFQQLGFYVKFANETAPNLPVG